MRIRDFHEYALYKFTLYLLTSLLSTMSKNYCQNVDIDKGANEKVSINHYAYHHRH